MAFSLPNPTSPTNGQSLDATPILANEVAIAQAIASFDGSQIQSGTITGSALATTANPNTLLAATTQPFVSAGVVWTTVSGLAGTMSGGTIYYNGTPVTVNSVASHTFTASQDTYIDVDKNGNVTYQGVSNGSSAPSLTANSIRVAKVVTSGSAITSIVLTGVDSNNVQIYPTSPQGFGNWISWTPTWTGLTVSGSTVTARYMQIGKIIHYRIAVVLGGSNAPSGTVTFSLPVTSVTYAGTATLPILGNAQYYITNGFAGYAVWSSTTTATLVCLNAAGTYLVAANLSSTVPNTFTNGSEIHVEGFYEAA